MGGVKSHWLHWLQSVNPITWIRTIFARKGLFSCVNWEVPFSEYCFGWMTFYTLDNRTSCQHGSAHDSKVRGWFGHKSQELSFVIRTFQLATFPFARIRVFCNFTSWMWMINLLVLGWGSPNHQNKWENDLLLDIFFGDNDFDTLNLKNSLTHSHSNRVLTITITL